MMSCLSKLLIGQLVAFELMECTSVDVFEEVMGVDSFLKNQVRVCNYLIETDHILITESPFCFSYMKTTTKIFIALFSYLDHSTIIIIPPIQLSSVPETFDCS